MASSLSFAWPERVRRRGRAVSPSGSARPGVFLCRDSCLVGPWRAADSGHGSQQASWLSDPPVLEPSWKSPGGVLKNIDKAGCRASVLLDIWFVGLSTDDMSRDEQRPADVFPDLW